MEAADERLLDEALALFDTEDAQNALESLLAEGRQCNLRRASPDQLAASTLRVSVQST